MPNPSTILQNTPWWVLALLVLLVVLGVQALRARTIAVWRLLAVPAVFIVWVLITLSTRSLGSPILLLDWLGACATGLAIGWRTARLDGVTFDRSRGLVDVPGSAFPLVRNVTIFAVKYGLGAAMAIVPAHRSGLIPCDVAVSGLAAGYFVGWLVRFGLKFRGIGARESLSTQ
jgi:hypothetical protein